MGVLLFARGVGFGAYHWNPERNDSARGDDRNRDARSVATHPGLPADLAGDRAGYSGLA